MTEETRPGFLANYKIVRPGPARPAFGPARLTPLLHTIYLARRTMKMLMSRETENNVSTIEFYRLFLTKSNGLR